MGSLLYYFSLAGYDGTRQLEVTVANETGSLGSPSSLCAYHHELIDPVERLDCNQPLTGRFVQLKLRYKSPFHLVEVEIIAKSGESCQLLVYTSSLL